ncbi:sugar transferase [Echinicola strongylocentroti]|uniref:Sugar transferase n=1 Tax=Echinicola strongylocentroti TaxID=1795355 RepID=A0A2Z4IFK0_9BACT|nr:sugar transferase [Echinicola strongylocentroti]AWW29862.1 sugar transferase [Echinicola strongylocentroti]
MYRDLVKPSFDRIAGFTGLVMLSPFIVFLALVLAIDFMGNPFFVQYRVGKNGRIFRLFKLRTMRHSQKKDLNITDKGRMTSLGRVLRKTSLDELPQFLNMALGDMSLVGPRPLLVEYLPLYNKEEAKRHLVKPGITGLAQINGRNALSWEEKFAYDLHYVYQLSFWLDIKIFIKSVLKPFDGKGIYGDNDEVKPFKGTRS